MPPEATAPPHHWSGSMYHRGSHYGAGNEPIYSGASPLELYPSDYSGASDSPDPDYISHSLHIQSSSLRMDTRSYTLSDALRPRHRDSECLAAHFAENGSSQSSRLSSEPVVCLPKDTRSPSVDRSATTTPSNADLEGASEPSTAQRVILVKEENEDSLEGLFVLESQALPAPEVVDSAPNLRFRRPRTPTTEAMRKRMTVFHVNPFASSRAQAGSSGSSSSTKKEPLDPAFLTFQLHDGTLEPVDDPEIQFFVTFVDECEYDEDSDEGDDPGHISWPHSVVKRHNDIYPMRQVPHVGNPFNEFTGLVMNGRVGGSRSADGGQDCSSALSTSTAGERRNKRYDASAKQASEVSSPGKKKPKTHECAICHKVFPRPSGLSTHMNSHSGDKPFKCPIPTCDKYFTVRSNAKRHLRTHRSLSPSDPIFGGPASSTSNGEIEFDVPLVTHIHEMEPKRLRWTRPSVALRPISELLESRPASSLGGGRRGLGRSKSLSRGSDVEDNGEDDGSMSEGDEVPAIRHRA
ncbi:hypothetical protein GLOTRDRAFT_132317 [Gloeophyllum trabeum ATCC 11539]|uniref:C2H2-type domain-containing protein n=1 Tax=Gloeophyllum trabeum (strain ATCC 11539 / FP-39264 / Madison 617) TaxID=670483 RepID=S7PX78_GLOTA|nr:uncharacterized protein GLOTRDRAFT_132317 [Gloeophyllum trabeum ATCC 11539]EPQ52201.1 hypothetical protein GLOTRDRAFT_132317 [Gloeophyllum trabeum ATCC 11539]